MPKKVLIIGGVAGGATTAARLRRNDESANIIVFERGEYISFANCGLPYYIGGVIQNRDSLIVQTVEDMSHKFRLDIRILSEVISIDPTTKTVTVKDLKNGNDYLETYDQLVISSGSFPIKPGIPGLKDATNLFTLTKYSGLDPEMTVSNNSTSEGDRANGIDWGTYPSSRMFLVGFDISI